MTLPELVERVEALRDLAERGRRDCAHGEGAAAMCFESYHQGERDAYDAVLSLLAGVET